MEGLEQEVTHLHRHHCPQDSRPCLYLELREVGLQESLETRQGSLKDGAR